MRRGFRARSPDRKEEEPLKRLAAKGIKMKTNFKKGSLVKVTADEVNFWVFKDTGEVVCNPIWRAVTEEETAAWYASPESKGMDSAGETKLPPQNFFYSPKVDEVFKVIRARVSAPRGYSTVSGCAEVEDKNGVRWFVRREHIH